jgi:hypothetical protein
MTRARKRKVKRRRRRKRKLRYLHRRLEATNDLSERRWLITKIRKISPQAPVPER